MLSFADNLHVLQIVAQLLSFPIGRAWARYVPRVIIFGIPLNPGPFTIKEHVRPPSYIPASLFNYSPIFRSSLLSWHRKGDSWTFW